MISSYNNEKVEFTGAKLIDCDWSVYNTLANGTIYQCNLNATKYNLTKHENNPIVPGLRINNQRAIRASMNLFIYFCFYFLFFILIFCFLMFCFVLVNFVVN